MSESAKPATDAPPAPRVEDLAQDLSGQVLDDYQVLRRIGHGGMGDVYLAHQLSLRRRVALKVLKPDPRDAAGAAAALARFKAEAEAVARATHANIVQIHAIGTAKGLNYMALEYVEGRNLHEFVERKKPISVGTGLRIMAQVAAALQRAGELNIVHRDIKPENILIARTGEVKVADFGLSRCFDRPLNLTAQGVTMGTPLYMSPEQVESERPVDLRSDIYSFGATCYYMFAAQPPFHGVTPIDVAYQHVHEDPEPLAELCPDLPAELCGIIHKMMAKSPDARYQTAAELSRDIAQLIAKWPAIADEVGQSSTLVLARALDALPVPARQGLRRWHALAAIGVLLALAAGLALGWWTRTPPPPDIPPDASDAGALLREKEAIVLKRIKDQYRPHGPLDGKVLSGLQAATELGLSYLRERRLDEADALFKELCPTDEACHAQVFCRLGKAAVLAYRKAAAQSNGQFRAAVIDIEHLEKQFDAPRNGAGKEWQELDDKLAVFKLLWRSERPGADVRAMVARALLVNQASGAPFPPELEPYLHPPRAVVTGGP